MNTFLQRCKTLVNSKLSKVIVIGNESCDLDSAVCCISLAFHLSKCPSFIKSVEGADRILPVLNVTREELPLKTEVVYYLQENRIDLNDLVCRDEVDLPVAISNTKVLLVDHHVSIYRLNVVGVVDHRQFESSSKLGDGIFKYIEQVGSCATLIMRMVERSEILSQTKGEYVDLLHLLYGAIVLDTVNFSKGAAKARELDHQMAALIEHHLEIYNSSEHRQLLFNRLVAKRSDVSCLDSLQILNKDLKIVTRSGRTVAIPGYPILVQEYTKLENAEHNLRAFADKTGSNVIILMGMKVSSADGSVQRDLGIINIDDIDLFKKIEVSLTTSKLPDFCLGKHDEVTFLGGAFYEQCNVKASRKQLLPLVNIVLDSLS